MESILQDNYCNIDFIPVDIPPSSHTGFLNLENKHFSDESERERFLKPSPVLVLILALALASGFEHKGVAPL